MASSVHNFTDGEFTGWLNALIATLSANIANYPGITAAMVTVLGNLRDTWADDLLAHDQVELTRKSVTQTKNNSRRAAAEEAIRLAGLTEHSGASEEALTALGFPKASPESVPSPATVPIATVDTSNRLQHTINFADAAAPNLKRRPKGVKGLQIWNKIDGPPPGSEIDCNFLATDSATPYTVVYPPEHAGKTVHYLFRWQFNDDTVSPWGETVSATITG